MCLNAYVHDRDVDGDAIMDEPGSTSTSLVSVDDLGQQLDGDSGGGDVADDGDAVYWSRSPAAGATGDPDVFVHDAATGDLTLVGHDISNLPAFDDSGAIVAFDSFTSNGVAGDTNNTVDTFAVDRATGLAERVSVDVDGAEVAFGGVVVEPSGDGRHVLFLSFAPNLVPGDTNGSFDLFVRDRQATIGGTPTLPGDDVVVTPSGPGGTTPVTLTFDQVTGAGSTTLTVTPSGPAPASGFVLGDPPTYYDVSTTASFDGLVTICFDYTGVSYPDEAALRLLHWVTPDGRWDDITTSLDPVADVICGRTSSFSPFAVSQRLLPFGGFRPPVDAQPTLNRAKAGSAVPVKFSLGGDHGLDIFAPGYPKSQAIPCAPNAVVDGLESTVTAGNSSLKYVASSGMYEYVWKTDKAWRDCRQLVLKFRDGHSERADFQFTK
jgi:hypothetical protein